MTAATECTLRVGIVPLRAGLTSVLPHADKPKLGDDDHAFARIRLIAGDGELLVTAGSGNQQGNTVAMAAVAIEEDDRAVRFEVFDGAFVVDLHPTMARDIIRMLSPIRVGAGEDPHPSNTGWAEMRLTLETVRVADVSGLWEGRRTTVPVLEYRPDFLDVPGIVKRAFEHASGTYKPLVTEAGVLSRFERAGKEYGLELQAEPTGTADSGGWLVFCGPDFAGVAEMGRNTGGSLGKRDGRRMRHLERAGLAKPALVGL